MELLKRQLSLPQFTPQLQSVLTNTCVSIVGCGGLGCSVGLYLAGAGIGKIIFIDGDKIDATNIHRQIAYNTSHINFSKVDILSTKCSQINTKLIYEKHGLYLDENNVKQLLDNSQVVIDCTDNSSTRILLNNYCKEKKKPLIFGSALGYDGQLCVFDFRKDDSKCIFCVFPDIEKVADTCSSSGVLGPVPGIIGNLQAVECIKLITGLGSLLEGMLHYSSLDTSFYTIKTNKCCKQCIDDVKTEKIPLNEVLEIDYKSYLSNKDNYLLYDIRERVDDDDSHILGANYEPNLKLENIDKNKNILLICEIGERSKKNIKEWREIGFLNCWSIKNGFRGI